MLPALTEGERWSRRALDDLRAARFSPAAIARFLLASDRRAREVRRARPALAGQARRWMAVGATAWSVLAAAGREPYRRRLTSGLAWWMATSCMLDWHLGMLETADGRPRPLGPADALTLSRAWLVPVIADDLHPGAVVLAATTDVLDGLAARATAPTRAGRDLEGLVDTAVHLSALSAGLRSGRLPRWAGRLEAARIAGGVVYAVLGYVVSSQRPDPAVARAARMSTPVRVAGLAAAGAGRRRLAGALVGAGSAAGLVALARSVAEGAAEGARDTPGSMAQPPAAC